MTIDYRAVGLKVGLEIHQQLESPRKLFCYCKPRLIDKEPDYLIYRFMRPTLSETGEIDPTIEKAFKRRTKIIYQTYKELCLYEIDEKPPEPVDRYSLITALLLAKIFGMSVPDVLFVSRKQYLDGSVPSGFQRTILLGLNGKLRLDSGKEIRIDQLCLEEDAARKISSDGNTITFRVDRLGIPLVEITTAPDMETPEEVLECALKIGAILRATRRVKRGLGTIRQDINVSIKNGARVEIKGVQYPELFKVLIDNEIKRQQHLIEIAKILKSRGVTARAIDAEKPKDVTDLFRNTKAKFIRRALKAGDRIIAIRLPGFGGLLKREIQPGRTFGKEFADRVKAIVGLAGIIHTDELPAYGISNTEKSALFREFNADPEHDTIAFVVGPKKLCTEAIEEIKERAKLALRGPIEETRRANPDGTTSFERPLGGAGRLYPDTDSEPIVITSDLLEEADSIEFEYPWETIDRLVKDYGLNKDDARRIVFSQYFPLFESILNLGASPKLFIRILNNITMLRRKGLNVDSLDEGKILEIVQAFMDSRISKEAIDQLMEYLARNPDATVEQAIQVLGLELVDDSQVREYILKLLEEKRDFIRQKREYAFKPLMGLVMAKFRGKIDGKKVAKILKEELSNYLNKLGS